MEKQVPWLQHRQLQQPFQPQFEEESCRRVREKDDFGCHGDQKRLDMRSKRCPEVTIQSAVNSKQSKAKQNKTKQNKTKQSKAKQSKTKQNKTKQSKAKQSKAKQSKAKQNKAKQIDISLIPWDKYSEMILTVLSFLIKVSRVLATEA